MKKVLICIFIVILCIAAFEVLKEFTQKQEDENIGNIRIKELQREVKEILAIINEKLVRTEKRAVARTLEIAEILYSNGIDFTKLKRTRKVNACRFVLRRAGSRRTVLHSRPGACIRRGKCIFYNPPRRYILRSSTSRGTAPLNGLPHCRSHGCRCPSNGRSGLSGSRIRRRCLFRP